MRTRRTPLCRPGLLAIAALVAMAAAPPAEEAAPDASADKAAPERAAERPAAPPEVGRPAPDFELPRLVLETADDGTTVGRVTDERVRLSSFRGKQAVCIFSSSYT